jgi:ABC-type transporter Mla subunit MlaD
VATARTITSVRKAIQATFIPAPPTPPERTEACTTLREVMSGLPRAAFGDDPTPSALTALAQYLTGNAGKVPDELQSNLRELVSVASGRAGDLESGSNSPEAVSDAQYQAALSRFHLGVLAYCQGR